MYIVNVESVRKSTQHTQMSEPTPLKLRKLVRRAGVSMERLARDMGYSHASGIQRYLSEGYTKERLDLEIAMKFAKALAGKGEPPITEAEVLALTGLHQLSLPAPNADLTTAVAAPRPNDMLIDIPVYGVAVGGDAGDFSLNGDVVDRVRRPPGLIGNKSAFAVYVRGDSMEPRHYQGDLLYVDPSRPARSGDDVLVELKPVRPGEPGPAYIKQLVTQGPVRVVLRQFNPAQDITLPGDKILRVSKILKLADLLGI